MAVLMSSSYFTTILEKERFKNRYCRLSPEELSSHKEGATRKSV